MQFPFGRRHRYPQGAPPGRRGGVIVSIVTSEGILSGRGAERSSAIPAVLLGVLAVHFAALIDLELVLDQLGIIVQLLQLDVPEELLEATYGRLLMRRHRVIAKRKRSLREIQLGITVLLSNFQDILSVKCLKSDLAEILAHASHNCFELRRKLLRNCLAW